MTADITVDLDTAHVEVERTSIEVGVDVPGLPGERGGFGFDFTYTGALEAYVSEPPWYNDTGRPVTVRSVRTSVAQPASAGDAVLDVTVDTMSMWANPANRPTLGPGVTTLVKNDMTDPVIPPGGALRVAVVSVNNLGTPLTWQIEMS